MESWKRIGGGSTLKASEERIFPIIYQLAIVLIELITAEANAMKSLMTVGTYMIGMMTLNVRGEQSNQLLDINSIQKVHNQCQP